MKPAAKLDISHLTYNGSFIAGRSSDHAGNAKTSFEQLVLPPGHKDLVKSLIAQHFRNKAFAGSYQKQTDIIRGKGKISIL